MPTLADSAGIHNLPMPVYPSCVIGTPSEYDPPKSGTSVLRCPARGGHPWFQFVGNTPVALK